MGRREREGESILGILGDRLLEDMAGRQSLAQPKS